MVSPSHSILSKTATKRKSSASLSASTSKRPRTGPSSSGNGVKLKFKSPAEFFAENKNIAGFDNPGKSLYTTIRELVENALDAAEAIDMLPDISVHIERIERDQFKTLVGIDVRDRIDHALYKDVENQKERKAREAREKREAKKQKKKETGLNVEDSSEKKVQTEVDLTTNTSQPQPSPPQGLLVDVVEKDKKRGGGGAAGASANEIFRVTVTDNGCGMPYDDVPNMMGRVLAGTKYCVRQARGKFGLGSKMALIWSKMSTGLPVHLETSTNEKETTECVVDIDIANNVPTVLKHERVPNRRGARGSKVSVTIEGNWKTYRAKIVQYIRQMAVITPYAMFHLKYEASRSGDDSKDLEMLFARRTDIMPPKAKEVKHHPSSVNQLILKQIIANVPPSTTLIRFFTHELESIPRTLAIRLVNELGKDFSSHMAVSEMNLNHIRQMDQLLHEARFDPPDGKCLSPAGEYNLRLGITKELRPSLVATHAEPADVFEGHPFIVEAGVALGGTGMKPGINVFRFANRIPLLFEAGSDVVSRTARDDIKWANYKISTTTDRIGVICSVVSTKVPFKGTGKEYIGDDSESIKASVKRAITQCCLQLKAKLVRRMAQRDAAERKKNITKYAPDVVNAVMGVFQQVEHPTPAARDVANKIQGGQLTKQMMMNKLIEHVQQIDKEQAIEYAAATGRDQKTMEPIFASMRSTENGYVQLNLGPMEGTEGEKLGPFRLSLLRPLQSAI